MATLRFLGCKGDNTLVKSKDFQADSSLLIESDTKVMINCGGDWIDKVKFVQPDNIVLTSSSPEHSFGIMKCDKSKVIAKREDCDILEKFFNEDGSMLLMKRNGHEFDRHINSITPVGKSVLIEIDGKNVLYAPEFCPEDLDGLKKADILIGSGHCLKDNEQIVTNGKKRQYVSMLNQISLCKKYGIDTVVFTSFSDKNLQIGRSRMYKFIADKQDGVDVTLAYHGYTMEVDAQEETLSVKQAFGSPGGKRFMLKHLMKYIPKHRVYVESFVGGGSLFFKKEPVEKEIICDRDPEIYFLYKYIQTCTDEDVMTLEKFNWRSNKQLFDKLKQEEKLFVEKSDPFSLEDRFECQCVKCGFVAESSMHCAELKCPKCGAQMRRKDRPGVGSDSDGKRVSLEDSTKGYSDEGGIAEPENPNKLTSGQNESKHKRFYRLMYLKRFSDAGFMKDYNTPTEGKVHTICKRIPEIRERLRNVTILNTSYEKAIREFDGPDTFHFIDPPYPNAQYPWKYQIQPEELQAVLKEIKGKFLLTYETEGKNIFTGFYQRFIKLRSQANPWRGVVNKTELLVANYPFDSRSKVRS